MHKLAAITAQMIGERDETSKSITLAYADDLVSDYGQTTNSKVDAIPLLGLEKSIFPDPVYSDKDMSGTIKLIKKSILNCEINIVFIHSGGAV
ncbi:hypothetical protein [Parasulfitobacter algicola]|uniref:Uncharacterized protein n=1 Tax=Parasulfitobacter algicola TaxID=2614809 RepID=A0ABX2IXS5_9RHOB|nr:hypothetical protein [Sulfitobacter algicola]NSX55183.1 hypothetical protein [Sulfitobacter algicola]